jgi:hypothetical protein
MKRIILTFFTFIFAFNLIQGQISYRDSVIANFETGLQGATTTAPTAPTVVANPLKDTINGSDSVLHFIASNWESVAIPFDSTEYRTYFSRIQFDVFVTTTSTITIMMDGGYAEPIMLYYNIPEVNSWQRVYYDLPTPKDMGYKRISFRTGQNSDLYLDNVTFQTPNSGQHTLLPIEKVVYGKVNNALDFSGDIKLHWDNDSLYAIFTIHDDTVVNTGGANYQRDNIEYYIDVNNSKRIHWPRNGGWVKAVDSAYDANDYQIRLVPGQPFAANNQVRPAGPSIDSGYYMQYSKEGFGYIYNLNIAWNALQKGFMPKIGDKIGLDVLVSDQDSSVVTDAGRNQITMNSPTIYPYNDPSLWGTLRLESGGLFTLIPDTTKPTIPGNAKATQTGMGQVMLTWDSAHDNIAVLRYIVYNGPDSITSVYGKQTGNSYSFTNLNTGNYVLGVVAVDNFGNKSTMATVTITVSKVAVTSITLAGAGNATSINTNGGTLQITATVLPDSAATKTVTWSVSDQNIATISSSGLLTAKSNGTVTVTATANDSSNVTGTLAITISGQLVGISIAKSEFTIGPNPVTDYLEIIGQKLIKSIVIINTSGQVVLNDKINSNNSRINVSNLQSGLYILRIQTPEGTETRRILKK